MMELFSSMWLARFVLGMCDRLDGMYGPGGDWDLL